MPQEPKKRHSRQRQGKRRASIKLDVPGFDVCPNCKSTIYPHTVCKKCGFYKDREVIDVLAKLTKKERKKKEKELKAREEQERSGKPLDAGELSKTS